LFADEVTPVDPNTTGGLAYLTIDGYQRAFAYPVNLTGGGALNDVRGAKIGVRFGVPRYIRPSPKLPVTVQLDGPLAGDYRVDVGLDRTGRKKQFQVMHLPGLRHQKIELAVSAAGNLICKTSVQDWQVEFDTTGVYGNMWLNVAVLKKNPDTGVYQEVELAASGGASGEWAPVVGEPNSKHLFARVTQDDTKPTVIALDFPKEWLTGKPLDLRATVGERGEAQAPIQSVVFLRGKIPADDKLDPKAVLGEASYDVKSEEWMFPLPAQDKPGELEISVLVTTRTGVKMHKTGTIALKAPGASLAKITGRIMRGAIPQPKSSVTLTDEKGKLLDTQKTNAKGEYVFDKVAPGVYLVTSRQAFPAVVGQVRVTVRPGDEAVENVHIRLVAK
jgi:hypothetical protein